MPVSVAEKKSAERTQTMGVPPSGRVANERYAQRPAERLRPTKEPKDAAATTPRTMSGAVPPLEVCDLACGYEGQAVLENLNFSVRAGEAFFIIGGSGCGKSTLLRNLIGLVQPLAGAVRFFGESLGSNDLECLRRRSRSFGVLYQSSALWSSLTLRENVALPLREYSRLSPREINELATLKLSQVGLCGFEDYYPSEISGGMKKRAGLARALALDPPIAFLDEPSAGLDPITARKLDELMLQIRDLFGTTLVVISHELGSIFRVADRLILLHPAARGIIAEGPPAELAGASSDPRVREFLQQAPITS
ncbi:ABC transporter ATP-binding protein [Cephaloticoccus primus]|nr:ATP-binding cassette domain-containing protein [Cephaloticoccus primus]